MAEVRPLPYMSILPARTEIQVHLVFFFLSLSRPEKNNCR